jgi:isochorismate synthase
MSFKSIAFCKLPHSSEILIYSGTVVKSTILEFELTEVPKFIVTKGLVPEDFFWISGDVDSAPLNSEISHLLKEHLNRLEEYQYSNYNSQSKITSQHQFSVEIERIKTAISNLEVEKIVAARIIQKDIQNQHFGVDSLVSWFVELCANYPDCLVYLFVDDELGIWIGASPELLFEREESGLSQTVSLAGTLFGESEVWSDKEKLEQSTTSRHINEILNDFNLVAEVSKVKERKNGSLRHLISQYSFQTQSNQILGLLERLNPTPAVIGYPQKTALKWVKTNLELNRELYSGAVGIVSSQNTLIHVNLRCAKVSLNQKIDLYAGCGINSMSDRAREWEETQLKSEIIGSFIPNLKYP